MSFLKETINYVLTLEADDTNTLTWYIDVALAVHGDMKIHIEEVLTMRKGEIIISSANKKVN